MQASKVTLSKETMQSMGLPLTSEQRFELRRTKAIAFVQQFPVGTKLSISAIARAAGVYPSSSQNFFMNRLKQEGTLTRHKEFKHDFVGSWTVDEEVKTIMPPVAQAPIKELEPTAQKPDIISLAKDYYWETGNDSLREFIKWLEAKEQ